MFLLYLQTKITNLDLGVRVIVQHLFHPPYSGETWGLAVPAVYSQHHVLVRKAGLLQEWEGLWI